MFTASRGLYGTIWRWHFYAGLLVAPFLIILSLTGAVYLFNTEINDALYPELSFASSDASALPPSELIKAAEQAFPGGVVTRIDTPVAPGRSAQLFVTTAAGEALRVFVDPPTAKVLGSYVYTRTLVGFADVMHGSLMLGDVGDAVVELAACWTFILICSGIYLWFPRSGWRSATWIPRLRLRGRLLWRDFHQIAGLYSAILLLFLIVSGLPWATIWGGRVLTPLSNIAGLGYPEGARRPLQSTGATVSEVVGEVPWTLRQAPMPASNPAEPCGSVRGGEQRSCAGAQPIGVDAAVRILAASGMANAYRLSLPRGRDGVYMAYTYPDQPEGQRTIQIDQYSGAVLGDLGFGDYGAVAKAVEWGVALHMGNYFGRLNQIVLLIPCIGVIASVVSGVVMWWKRRPQGRFGAPAKPSDRVVGTGLTALIVGLGTLFPLAGLSMIAVWLADWALLMLRQRPAAAGDGNVR